MRGRKKQRARAGRRDPEFSREAGKRGLFGKATGAVLAFFVLALAVAVIVPVAPEYRKLQAIESEYADVQAEERALLKKRRQYELEAQALMQNPDYLESRARDRGPYYRPGEQVLKIPEG